MVIDTSTLVAILQREPERRLFIEAIEVADTRLMSVATFVEISIVIEAHHGVGTARAECSYTSRMGSDLAPVLADAQRRKARKSDLSGSGYEGGETATVGASRKGRI